jgi:hypothetical protein
MTAARIVEAFDEGERCIARLGRCLEPAASEKLALERGEEALAQALSYVSPTEPIEGRTPAPRQRWPNSIEVYCEPWSE